MDRNEAIKILKGIYGKVITSVYGSGFEWKTAQRDVCSNVEKEAIITAITALDKDTNVPSKWIPVTPETLPEKGKVVVVYGDGRTWDVGMYHGHGNDINLWHWKKNTFKRVYWWMYKKDALPEPHKEGEEIEQTD